jgi:hypothetical protein
MMAFQLSVAARNATLAAIETEIGLNPILTISTGSKPVDAATANTGTVLATMVLPSDWLGAAASGSIALSGTWQDLSADDSGTAGYFRLHNNAGTECHMQGSVSATGAGGDMQLDNTNIATGQQINITTFTITAGGA